MKIPVNKIFKANALSNSEPNNNNIGLEKTNNFIEIQGVNTIEQLSGLEKVYEKLD